MEGNKQEPECGRGIQGRTIYNCSRHREEIEYV